MTMTGLVSIDDVRAARRRLSGVAVVTPLDRSRALSEQCGGEVFIKCENLQRTGSFKIRGAYNRISQMDADEKARGVVAASAGNHAQGVALGASIAGTSATVFMPEQAPLPKIEATKRYGAEVRLSGKDIGASLAAAMHYAEAEGKVFVHPFDHPHVIAGQGTVGLEICDSIPNVGTVVVPVGGGGLISGIAAAVKALRPEARLIGVQATGAASYPPSLERGEPVALEHLTTIADGIACNRPGHFTFTHVQALVDDIVTVSDDAIAEGLVFTAERMKLVLEPAGAAAVAGAIQHPHMMEPPVVVLLSGGNIDPLLLLRVVRYGLSAAGRYFSFHTRIADRPGELYRLLGLIAEQGANIVGVEHHREGARVHVGDVAVALQVETKGPSHIEELVARLGRAGYGVERL
ncbi:MAG TPA: threonine ammonia-lyase [Actinomycetota bacterium]|nr:threonine ammonia-lyase [Actinomycetota bacterium]